MAFANFFNPNASLALKIKKTNISETSTLIKPKDYYHLLSLNYFFTFAFMFSMDGGSGTLRIDLLPLLLPSIVPLGRVEPFL